MSTEFVVQRWHKDRSYWEDEAHRSTLPDAHDALKMQKEVRPAYRRRIMRIQKRVVYEEPDE